MIRAYAITGPTASGKTAVSIEVARTLGAEIICCDSMQIYKYMDIGTAKPTEEERRAVKHYMTDFLSPNENYSAQSYRADALKCAKQIVRDGKIPLFVGGTGLYIDTLLRSDTRSVPESSEEYRVSVMNSLKTEDDVTALWERLYSVDPESAEKIHKNNIKRVIRALEIYDKTGKPKSYFDALAKEGASEIDIKILTLDFHDRENLYSRVDRRVDLMMDEGLLAETEYLYGKGYLAEGTTASQAIGYKELLPYLKGESELGDAVERLKLGTRRYAKRQLTWFRHTDAERIYVDTAEGAAREISDIARDAINYIKIFEGIK